MDHDRDYNPMTPDFGLFHLSIYDAARFTAKIHLFEYDLDVEHPDEPEFYEMDNPELDVLLKDYYKKYETIFVAAIHKGSLKVWHIERDLEDNIDIEGTMIEIHDLANWLERRGNPIWGDYFEDYQSKQFDLHYVAEKAIEAELVRRKDNIRRTGFTDSDLIAYLENENKNLKEICEKYKQIEAPTTPIHPREKETYQNIIGALLGVLLGKSSSDVPFSNFENQQAIIDMIHNLYGDRHGLSKRNLESKFAESKRTLKSNFPDSE